MSTLAWLELENFLAWLEIMQGVWVEIECE